MWNYRKLSSNDSPMAEILNRCTCRSNIRLVVYHLSENHVECATTPDASQFSLGETARTIKADSRHNHAVLAFDLGSNEVYKIEDVPELPVASAVLLCIVTELLNGCVQSRENQYGAPVAETRRHMPTPPRNVMRDSNGRFVRCNERFDCDETHEAQPMPSSTNYGGMQNDSSPLSGHRFRLGRH